MLLENICHCNVLKCGEVFVSYHFNYLFIFTLDSDCPRSLLSSLVLFLFLATAVKLLAGELQALSLGLGFPACKAKRIYPPYCGQIQIFSSI